MIKYKRWITNCPADEAFERLMQYSAQDPNGSYTIDRPRETMTICDQSSRIIFNSYRGGVVNTFPVGRGCTVDELENTDYRAIYECFERT